VKASASGVVSVTGGKLTTYRKMAADGIDVVVKQLGFGRHRSPTKHMPIRGATGLDAYRAPGVAARLGVDEPTLAHLLGRHGNEAGAIAALIKQDASLGRPLVPGLPYLRAEAVWAVREEMATTLEDVLARRTRAQLKDRAATAEAAADVAALIGPELGWTAEETAGNVAAYRSSLADERAAVLS
jgi:glycerol-3-phosphate dehydrogenase